MSPDLPIYQFDPNQAPDSDFEPGALELLVPGNRGRMLDPRRTPIRIVDLQPELGHFVCEVLDFEDRGARWSLTLESVAQFQFERDSPRASTSVVRELETAIQRFSRQLRIPCDREVRSQSLRRLAAFTQEADTWIGRNSSAFAGGEPMALETRRGDPRLWSDLERYLGARDLLGIDEEFTYTYVTNPDSGEVIKGHRIVLAEVGLAPYRGSIVRDPRLFHGIWTREARAAHILHRMAFVQAVLGRLGLDQVRLYRGFAGAVIDSERRPCGFVSASFLREVAEAVIGPPDCERVGQVQERLVDRGHFFMSYLETKSMNRQFHEAEGVLIADGEGTPF